MFDFLKNVFSNRRQMSSAKQNNSFKVSHLEGVDKLDPKSYLLGTLNTHHETGMEGGYAGVVALSEGEIKKVSKEKLSYGFLYDISSSDKFAVFDKNGRRIYDRGAYLVADTWERPNDLGPCRSGHGKIKEGDWAHWCKNHFMVIVYLF